MPVYEIQAFRRSIGLIHPYSTSETLRFLTMPDIGHIQNTYGTQEVLTLVRSQISLSQRLKVVRINGNRHEII